jgi:hypothetical protein
LIDKNERLKGTQALLSGIGVFLLFHLISYMLDPEIYIYYLKALPRFSDEERGVVNPCIIALIGEGVDYLIHKGHIQAGSLRQIIIYSLYLVVVAVTCFLYFKTYYKTNLSNSPLKLVLFTFLAFAVLVPRFKDYSYILLIPSAIYLLREKVGIEERIMFFILTVFPPIFSYYPYVLVWIFFLYFIWREGPKQSEQVNKKVETYFIAVI